MTKKLFFVFIIAFLISSCARDVANRYYGDRTYPPKNPSQVELLKNAPAREYIVIADFQSRGESPQDMREKAARIGADAVIVSTLGGYYSKDDQWADSDTYSGTYSRITGTAIKYK
jgi:hypothetical protein